MRLSGKLLQEIVGRTDVRFSGIGSQRALGRLSVEAPATLYPIRDGLLDAPVEVTIQDISAETAGIVSRWAMMPGTGLVVCLPRKNTEAVAVECQVVRCHALGNGAFVIAARFVGFVENGNATAETQRQSREYMK